MCPHLLEGTHIGPHSILLEDKRPVYLDIGFIDGLPNSDDTIRIVDLSSTFKINLHINNLRTDKVADDELR